MKKPETGYFDVYIIRTDSMGNEFWNRRNGGDWRDGGTCVVQTNDRGILISGWTDLYGSGGFDVYLIKTDSLGYVDWIREVQGKSQ